MVNHDSLVVGMAYVNLAGGWPSSKETLYCSGIDDDVSDYKCDRCSRSLYGKKGYSFVFDRDGQRGGILLGSECVKKLSKKVEEERRDVMMRLGYFRNEERNMDVNCINEFLREMIDQLSGDEIDEDLVIEARARKASAKKAAGKKPLSKLAKLKAKYIDPKTGRFKGKSGERFKNCVAFMKEKGGVKSPEGVCAKIARSKGLAPGKGKR